MKRLELMFTFTETEEAARAEVERRNREASPYCRKRYPAHFTPWQSPSPTDPAHFIVWFRR